MLRIKKLDHIAICVADTDQALSKYKQVLGLEPQVREVVASQKTEATLLPIGDTSLELISPKGNDGLVKFLEKRGPGLHHIAVEVEGIADALATLKALGVPLIDETPRSGARGHHVAFVHPKATGGVLVELVEPRDDAPVVATRNESGELAAEIVFRQLFDKESSTYTYVIADRGSGEAALVDPVVEHIERDLKLVDDLGCKLTVVLDTHVHADHVTGAGKLRERTNATTHVSALGGAPCADVGLTDGHVVNVGRVEVRALATPGHTNGCMSFVVRAPGEPLRVLTGDALLVRGCGRTDFQEGDPATLFHSVRGKLFALPDDTLVYPAHDYRGFNVSTIGEEKRLNPRLGGSMTEERFVTLMNALDLPPPGKIHEAVPANRACGQPSR